MSVQKQDNFRLEALEQRVLLDATLPLTPPGNDPLAQAPASAITVESQASEAGQNGGIFSYNPEGQVGGIFDTGTGTPASGTGGTDAGEEAQDTAGEVQGKTGDSPVQAGDSPTDSTSTYSSSATSTVDQLTETLHSANGPPDEVNITFRTAGLNFNYYLLRFESDSLQVLDLQGNTLLSQPIETTTHLIFDGTESLFSTNTFVVDQSIFDQASVLNVTVLGSPVIDELKVQGVPGANRQWVVDQPGGGHLQNVRFSSMENLTGGDDDEDTFILVGDGVVAGAIDGGANGFDSVTLTGTHSRAVYGTTGSDSGTIELDGVVMTYRGLEPITDTGAVADRVVGYTGGNDQITVSAAASPNDIHIAAVGAESIDIKNPANSLTIQGGIGNDVFKFNLTSINTSIILDGGPDTDTVDVTGTGLAAVVVHFTDGSTALLFPGDKSIRVRNIETFIGTTVTATIEGVPQWTAQGPGPVLFNNPQPLTGPNNPVAGAIQAVAVNPTDATNIYVGTVNGGIWRTNNANLANPAATTWVPLTEQFGSLSIGSIAFSPLDVTGKTVFAGTGQFSNGFDGGEPIGILRTTDGGNTWALLAASSLSGKRVKEILPTSIQLAGEQVILAAIINGSGRDADGSRDPRVRGGGLYRSVDSGKTFTVVAGGLPAGGAVTQIIVDPTDNTRFYAAIPNAGIFRSDAGSNGATWTAVNTGFGAAVAGSSQIEIAAHTAGNILYAAIANETAGTIAVFRAPVGSPWTPLAAGPAGLVVGLNFAEKINLIADPVANNVVYIAGQGATNIFRYNPAGAGSWVSISGAGAQANTAPHPESRDLEFINGTTLLKTDDGGIFFLQNPTNAAANPWVSLNGNLDGFEVYSVAYDSRNGVIIAGLQDNGSAEQTASGSSVWQAVAGGDFRFAAGGDGQFQDVDNTSLATDTFRYSLENNLAFFYRNRYSNANNLLNTDRNTIVGATNATPIVITAPGHNLQNGDGVLIAQVSGNNAANGSFIVANRTANTFDLTQFAGGNVAGNGNYTGGGFWKRLGFISAIGGAAGTPVRITSNNHGLTTGDQVVVQQMNANIALNDSHFYVTVTNANTFTLNGTSATGTAGNTGLWARTDAVLLKSRAGAADFSALNLIDGGIKPITGATNANPIVITSAAHGLQNRDSIIIANVRGNTNANGSFTVANRTANTFQIRDANNNLVQGNANYTGGGTWRRSLGFDSTPFVLNAVDPRRMLIGHSGLYEDADVTAANGFAGDVIKDITNRLPVGFGGPITALVYGGFQLATAKPDVAYVGTSLGRLYFRQTAGTNFTELTGAGAGRLPTAGVIRDIAIDPQDWRRVYVIRDNQVWFTNNVSDLPNNNFTNITENLLRSAADPGGLTTQIRSIALADTTPATANDSILLVGGLGGVFRRLPSITAGKFVWTEYGSEMPNAVVNDIDFVNADPDGDATNGTGLLIAGTFGGGVRTLANVSQTISKPGLLKIDGTPNTDIIRLVRSLNNPTLLFVFLDGVATSPHIRLPLSALQQIKVNGGDDPDILLVNSDNGVVAVPDGINYDGGDGNDTISVLGSGTTQVQGPSGLQVMGHGANVAGIETINLTAVETITNAIPNANSNTAAILGAIGGGLLFGGGTLAALLATGNTNPLIVGPAVLGAALLGGVASYYLVDALNGSQKIPVGSGEEEIHSGQPEPEEEEEGGDSVSLLGNSSFLERIFASGSDGFSLSDIGSSIDALNILKDKLDALPGSTVNLTQGGGTTTFDVVIDTTLDGAIPVDLDIGGVRLAGGQEISADLHIHLIFGVDANGFFLGVDNTAPEIIVKNIQTQGAVSGGGQFGFLEVTLADAGLHIDPTVQFTIDLKEPVATDSKLRISELTTAGVISFGITSTDPSVDDVTFGGDFKVAALLPGMDEPFDIGTAEVDFIWKDVNDFSSFQIHAHAGPADDLVKFLDVGAQQVLDTLTTFKSNVETLFGAEIPFLSDSLTQLIGLVTDFQQKVLGPISGGVGGTVDAATIQRVITRTADSLGVSPESFGLSYDQASQELTFHLVLNEEILDATKALGAGVDLAGGLADLEFNTTATVTASVVLDTTLGIDVGKVIGDPRDWFFLRNTSVTGQATISATDIEASARFGFLSIGIDEGSLTDASGTGPATASIGVQLLDPDNNDPQRINLREILDNLAHLDKLIKVTGGGSVKLVLPVETSFLPGLPDIPDGGPFDPDKTITVLIPDLNDPSTFQLTLGPGLTEVGNFTHMNAASMVGVLGQLTFWLDEFRRSDTFAKLDLPLVGPALDEALQLADNFRDLVLLDDADNGLDDGKTLLNDLNAALDDAKLGRKLFAANVEGKIGFFALDAGITSFAVTGATALGFSASQPGSVPAGKFFAQAVATTAFGDAEGNLAADLSFNITIGAKTYEVKVAKSATDANTTIGDDRWKLINANNAPTFATAQQMSLRLLDAFGIGYPGVSYDPIADSINFTLDLSQVFASLNLPFDFDVKNLPDFLQLQTSGELALKVSGGLNLEVGVFLGDAEPSDKLQSDTPLADLSQPVILNDNQRYDAQPIVGKLTDDAHFSITIDGGGATPVTVTKALANNNTTILDLIADINQALLTANLNTKVRAEQVPATGTQPAPQQIQFVGLAVGSSLTITADSGDPAVTDIGLPTSKIVTGANPTLVAAKTVAALKGRLTADAGFTITLTKGGATDLPVLLTQAQTQDNTTPFSIINDIETQLNTGRIKVSFSGGALTFATTDGSTIQVKNVTGTATNELGVAAGNGNGDDLLIMVRSGASFRVPFDSGDTTIQHIIDAIETATANKVTVDINAAGSALKLTDHTTGGGTFKIQVLNNSTAGLLLGIVRPDSSGAPNDPPDGIIEGADIAALTALDRFFIKATPPGSDPLAGLKVEVGTPAPLTASAKFGFVGLGLQGEGGLTGAGITPANNALNAALTIRLLEPAGSTDGRVSLAELIDALGNIGSLFDLSLTGQGQLNLSLTPATITSLTSLGIDVGSGPRIEIKADMTANVFDGHLPTFSVTTSGFDELNGFGNLKFSFESILAGLAALVDFLDDFEALSFLNDPIPVIDVSIKDLISIAQQFNDAVTAAQNDPAGTLQVLRNKLLAAFGLPPNSPQLDLLLVDGPNGSKVLKIDTQLTTGFSKSLPINLDLGLDPLEFGGDADLLAQGSLRLDLDFGFDIEDPLKIYVFDTTGIAATLNLAATDLDFKAAVGPLGVFITDGTAQIKGTLPGSPANKVLTAGFSGSGGMIAIDEIDLANDLSVAVGGSLNVSMPVFFPTESLKRGTVKVTGNLSYDTFNQKLNASLVPSAVGPDGVTPIGLGDLFKFDPGNLSLLDQLLLGIDGVDLFLEGLQDLLGDSIGGFQLPLVGNKLSGAANAIGDFRDGFIEQFRKAVEELANPALAFAQAGIAPGAGGVAAIGAVPQGVDPISKMLFKLLGPSGLHLLNSQSDIFFDTNIRTESNPRNVFFDWRINMGGVLAHAGGGIGFDLGIPGLGLETEGRINLDVSWTLKLGFGVNFDDGFYLDIGSGSELRLTARVTTPGLGVTGRLGFLQIEGHENVEADEPANDRETERGDTGLAVQFGIDILNRQNPGDQRLGFSELGRIGIDAKIAGRALVDLQMALKLNSDLVPNPGNFPSIVADFAFDWGLGTVDDPNTPADEFNGVSLSSLNGGFLKNGLRYVGFHDVGLDLGKYFSDVIGPIVAKVQEVTGPIKPFLDFLTEPIPVISDLAGPTSLLDIAAMSGLVNPGIIKAIEVIDQVVDIVDRMSSVGGTDVVLYFDSVLPAGALVLYEAPAQGLASVSAPGGFLSPSDLAKPVNLQKLKGFTSQLNLPGWANGLADALGDVAQGLADSVNSMKSGKASGGFKIDIIDDPSQIFGMLMGQPANLVSFTMAPLEVEAEFSAFFSIFGPLGVSINAEFSAKFGPFTFGYDTYGISQFAASGFRNPLLLFDGLYVGDLDESGNDVPEIQFDAGLWAAAELNLGIARGGVGGGLFAEINFNLYDPDHDGKVRIKELITTIGNEIKYGTPALSPLAIFDISGKLTAELFWFIKIDLGFFEINEKGQITPPLTLLSFENVFTRYPTLGTELGNGVLQLNIGKNAAARIEGDLTDGKEIIHVKQGSDANHVKVWGLTIPESKAQEYLATNSIVAFAGEGDDEIYLSGVTSNVKLEIYGDAGNDIIVGTSGTGSALLVGGAGDDELTGGNGADTLFGEAGIDKLWGRAGNDWLFGDGDHKDYLVGSVITANVKASDGGDFLYGEDNDDLLVGAGGTDTIEGGGGDDVLLGDGGEVTVLGDRRVATTRELDQDPDTNDPLRLELAVRNTSKTGKGANDNLDGGTGNDHLYGGFGNDELNGGDNNDVIYGEHGTDTANGGSGDDVIFGDFGVFKEVTIGAVTTLEPFVTTGGERDILSGGPDNDKVLGGAGNDTLQGNEGNDQIWGGIGQDTIWGDNDNGTGSGDDTIYGEGDSDKLYGGAGNDYLEGGGGNDLALGDAGEDTLVAGYGSDTLDGEADGDIYRISVRGGPVTELTTAYDTGLFGVDSLIVVGTPGDDTLLLRAMADSYFPTLTKLQGLIERFFNSTIADRLAAMLQAFNDAYGPWDIPQGMIQGLTNEYQENLAAPLKAAVTGNRGSLLPTDAPTLASLGTIVDDVLASNADSKLDALQKAMTAAYTAANRSVPNTLFSALTAAYKRSDATALSDIKASIVSFYVPEKVEVLGLIVDAVFADANVQAADRMDEITTRIGVTYRSYGVGAGLQAMQDAWDNLPPGLTKAQQKAALKDALKATYPVGTDDKFTDTAFIAVINEGGADVERFNYRRMEGLVVSTLGGADYVVLDDLMAAATINLGDGNDRVQVGQVFRSERVRDPEGELITGITAEDVFTTVEITRGWLSNGVSVPTTINGGDGEDNFTVFRNVAVLNLNGGDGDDVFTVRAFALKGSSDNERARTDMKGDGGADTILYVVNAPVGIDGGDGFDTVRIVGTEFADDFVVTDSGVFGAGLNVTFVNIERLVADGAEGDDRFFIMSTGIEVVTEIDGGLGSDTYFVGGNPSRAPIAVVSNDLRGHSGIILHSVESSDTAWAGLPVEGLSANVGDDEEAMVLMTESNGRSFVVEGATGAQLGATDSYHLRLSRAPAAGTKVVIAVVPAGLSPEEEAKNFADLELSRNGIVWSNSLQVEFNAGNWSTGVDILIRAKQDAGYEGRRFTFINHKIDDLTSDVTFFEAQVRSVKVQMEDDDRDGVIITPSGLGNLVLEGGFTDSFQAVLSRAPIANVNVALSLAGSPAQVLLNGAASTVLTFTTANWNVPQTVTVSAVDDAVVEGFHTEYIRFDVTSTDREEIKGPFTEGQVVKVSGTNIAATKDPVTQKVWLQIDGKIDQPGVQVIPNEGSTFVLLPHRPIAGTLSVRVAGEELAPERFSLGGNTVTFISATGTPESRTGKVEVNYQYKEVGYDKSEVRDQVVDIYDNDTPTVIIQPAGDGMLDVVEDDPSATDTYTVRLASAPTRDVIIVVDSVKTRTTWGANAYFEIQLLLSDSNETNKERISLKFTPNDWNIEQVVTVRAKHDTRIDGNDTQVFAPDLQTVNKIRGPLIIDGAAGAGSLSLPRPVMLPWELNQRQSDGKVGSFTKATTPAAPEYMIVQRSDLDAVVNDFKTDDPTFTLLKLIDKTLEMTKGPGVDIVLDPNRPEDKFDRFWRITALEPGFGGDPTKVRLTLQNPTAVDPTQSNVTAPTADSEYAITSLSVNFFADEREQVDYLFMYDNDSVGDDRGALTSADGVVRGFDAFTSQMTVETSALQRTANLLRLGDIDELKGRKLEITVGPGLGHVYQIADISTEEGETKVLTLSSVSGSGTPTNRSEYRIEGSDRFGRITGFGMGPNVIFSGRPQGGGITYGDIEVVQVELGRGNDVVRVDYATNSEDHATVRTGDFNTQTILKTGPGNDEVTVVLTNGDSNASGDGAFALDTEAGNDKVFGAASTRPLVVFGGEGNDEIHTGSGADIVFGDYGRVDYTRKFTVQGVQYDAVITRLGSSVPQNPVNPHVTFATNNTVQDSAILGTKFQFPVDYEGLIGLSMQIISPEGHVQYRTVIANTADTITVDTDWTEFPVYNAADSDDNYYYRVSAFPDDQTDGLFRGPRVIWSVKNDIGGNDDINGGPGQDIIIGGAGNDTVDSDAGADWVAGDDARFDFAPVSGNDGPTKLVTILDPGTAGDDTLTGGDTADLIIGGLGNDTIYGAGASDILIGDAAKITYDSTGVFPVEIETIDRGNGGRDIIFGQADDDIIIGGSNSDWLDGGMERDLIFGDNVLLRLNVGSGNSIDPRFRALSGAIIYDANGLAPVRPQFAQAIQPVPGGRPAWADWTITLDQTSTNFGDDYIAGGGGDDTIFGQLGNDTIQGDGSIDSAVDGVEATKPVGASRSSNSTIALTPTLTAPSIGKLTLVPSFEAATDGDDYIEGNAGNDVIFGNLGQDDIIGGSSNLFSYSTVALRPDGQDIIFGGAGTRVGPNEDIPAGDAILAEAHARDADAIAGDNANIYRLVGTQGVSSGNFLQFEYDKLSTRGTRRIIPRAIELLDYTLGGPSFDPAANSDIGGADELHGESGDDFIYGMKGNDVLFGDSEDDDLIGGWGNDWISGGTGQDGILGDDGRIFTSRNSTTFGEPLYGIAPVPAGQIDLPISTPGNMQRATINVTNALKKTADLTPFNLTRKDLPDDPLNDPDFADDVIYGGLDDDFIHGGAGDDAISGAEAQPQFFVQPANPGNILRHNPAVEEFADYDENNPMTRLNPFLLNFDITNGRPVNTVRTDGNDVIFGDLGNDWIVGGTGKDQVFGGWGDDLMNMDDDHGTNNGLNNQPDTNVSYEDRAYGGAGRDVLIANTGGDRLIDWAGEFNSYLVPFAPFGMATVSRALQPQIAEFLYQLSASLGADLTQAAEQGSDPARNGEPFGELGMVRQQDAAWRDQTGAPADPQPGNTSGGKRDVLRSAAFDGTQPNAPLATSFTSESGLWKTTNGAYETNPAGSADQISLMLLGDQLPTYSELVATVNANKAKAGVKSNAYIIFDYQSATNFKYAGIDTALSKVQIGQRTTNGWSDLAQTNLRLDSGVDYQISVVLDRSNVSFLINGAVQQTYKFAAAVNTGMVGVGASNSVTRFDNIMVLVLPPPVPLTVQESFTSGTTVPAATQSGQWQVSNGKYQATPSASNDTAVTTWSTVVDKTVGLRLQSTVNTANYGGLIFDYQNEMNFKFAGVLGTTGQVVLGHRDTNGWTFDAVLNSSVHAGVDYKLSLSLRDSSASLYLNERSVLNFQYSSNVVDGYLGLFSLKGNTLFDDLSINAFTL